MTAEPVHLADYEFDRTHIKAWYEFYAKLPIPKPAYLIVTEDDIKALASIGNGWQIPVTVLGIPIYTQAQVDRGDADPVRPGVWVVYSFGADWTVTKIFAGELDAYRAAEDWEKVRFVPFGADVIDTLRSA